MALKMEWFIIWHNATPPNKEVENALLSAFFLSALTVKTVNAAPTFYLDRPFKSILVFCFMNLIFDWLELFSRNGHHIKC